MSDFTDLHKAYTFEREGAHTAALFIHGICGSPHVFAGLMEDIKRIGVNVYAILLPGHGSTAHNFTMARERDWQKCVQDELARLNALYTHVIVIGHSMGGLLGIMQAIEHQTDALVLINVPMQIRPSITQITMGSKVFLGNLCRNARLTESERIYKETFAIELANPLETALWLPQIMDLFALITHARKRLGRVRCRTLILQSRLDETVYYKSALILHEGIKMSHKPYFLPKSIHAFFPPDDYELMKAAITTFIKKIEKIPSILEK